MTMDEVYHIIVITILSTYGLIVVFSLVIVCKYGRCQPTQHTVQSDYRMALTLRDSYVETDDSSDCGSYIEIV